MQFSDEINLIEEVHGKDALNQYRAAFRRTTVWCDLTSVSGTETSNAGQNGHSAEARAVVHAEDYSGQKIVEYLGSDPILGAGLYDVYRTFKSGDCFELYLQQREGLKENVTD